MHRHHQFYPFLLALCGSGGSNISAVDKPNILLFLRECFVLRKAPDAVLKAVGKHVDVFSAQALILSRHRPPEWQQFQVDGWDHEMKMTGKPILVVDWAAPFSLGAAFETEHGPIKTK